MTKSTHLIRCEKGILKVAFYAPVFEENVGAGAIDVGIGIIYDYRYQIEVGDIDWEREKRTPQENKIIQEFLDEHEKSIQASLIKSYEQRNKIDF